jgi:hypothetical protein
MSSLTMRTVIVVRIWRHDSTDKVNLAGIDTACNALEHCDKVPELDPRIGPIIVLSTRSIIDSPITKINHHSLINEPHSRWPEACGFLELFILVLFNVRVLAAHGEA